jgi:Icc-related predicted phosphoesterase
MNTKMKIAICSDLHLEFAHCELKNDEKADVLILSGDICVAADILLRDSNNIMGNNRSNRYHEFFENCCSEFPHVVYVVGNHEHYHGDFVNTIDYLNRCLGYLPNLHILEKEVFELNDVVFVGGTLWTDMNKEDPLTIYHIKSMMNDFRVITNSARDVNFKSFDENGNVNFKTRPAKFSPEDAIAEHRKMLDYIRIIYEQTPPWKSIVVVGHHTPSHSSVHPRYASDNLMNGGYHSDLTEFILDRPGIKLWTHGHTHENFDYMIAGTRVVCNPRGYDGYEDISDTFTLKYVEI